MFDCFIYDGAGREETYQKYFVTPKVIDKNLKAIADETITDKFKLYLIESEDEYDHEMVSYGVALVIEVAVKSIICT